MATLVSDCERTLCRGCDGSGGVVEAAPQGWRRGVGTGGGSERRRADRRGRQEMMPETTAHDRHNFLAATMRIFLVVSPPGKLQ
ncbi:hypothetical protein J6590_102606, partial [Homalodisca vitripennis]